MVLCVDEKSQIQALDRPQPDLPLKQGRCGTRTHDYKPHGNHCLFAALELAQGKVIGDCYRRHRHQEFLRFLRLLDQSFPGDVPCTWCSTTTEPTVTTRHRPSCGNIPALSRTLCPPAAVGSISSNAGFESSPSKPSAEVPSIACPISSLPSGSSCWLGTRSRSLLSGPPPWNPFWPSFLAAARLWSKFNPAALCRPKGNARNVQLILGHSRHRRRAIGDCSIRAGPLCPPRVGLQRRRHRRREGGVGARDSRAI